MLDINLDKLQRFFKLDAKIKNGMYYNVPSVNYLDEETICKYTDKLDSFLKSSFKELKEITIEIFGKNSKFVRRIIHVELDVRKNFYSCGLSLDKLRTFYSNYISNMEPSFVDNVKKTCVGTYLFAFPPIDMVFERKTI